MNQSVRERRVYLLQHLCLIRVATCLWNSNNLRQYTKNIKTILLNPYYTQHARTKWIKIYVNIRKKAKELCVPKLLQEEIANQVKPLGDELLAWLYKNYKQYECSKLLVDEVCWTDHGKVDHEETARALMLDESLTYLERYKLACCHQLQDYVYLHFHRLNAEEIFALSCWNVPKTRDFSSWILSILETQPDLCLNLD